MERHGLGAVAGTHRPARHRPAKPDGVPGGGDDDAHAAGNPAPSTQPTYLYFAHVPPIPSFPPKVSLTPAKAVIGEASKPNAS